MRTHKCIGLQIAMMSRLISVVLLLLALNPGSKAQDSSSALCHQDELCTSVQRCEESDDSGRKFIGPRISRLCGVGRICCEKAQLESWDMHASNPQPTRSITLIQNKVSPFSEPLLNESCGLNKKCMPRKLCRDNVINDPGIELINSRISSIPCSRVLYRCCSFDQSEDALYG
ncbi:uncharacterized protein LOC108049606 [Drosophila rhopaloa]|uniref:PPAF-2-like Clip domain-containing protein n=1 Tax=Drosophila rhopaloa TaxID=1041015 RepID=A0ABM5HWC0_DRORH|nr:uncharacterized protein LOC108049606 [Drosophila rhopaloa]